MATPNSTPAKPTGLVAAVTSEVKAGVTAVEQAVRKPFVTTVSEAPPAPVPTGPRLSAKTLAEQKLGRSNLAARNNYPDAE